MNRYILPLLLLILLMGAGPPADQTNPYHPMTVAELIEELQAIKDKSLSLKIDGVSETMVVQGVRSDGKTVLLRIVSLPNTRSEVTAGDVTSASIGSITDLFESDTDVLLRELERRVSQLEKATTPAAIYKAFETEYMKEISKPYETLDGLFLDGTSTEPLPDTRPTPTKSEK